MLFILSDCLYFLVLFLILKPEQLNHMPESLIENSAKDQHKKPCLLEIEYSVGGGVSRRP